MTNLQFLNELLRQEAEFKKHAANQTHPAIKAEIDKLLATTAKGIGLARESASIYPDAEVSFEMEEGILKSARALAALPALLTNVPSVTPAPVPLENSLLVYLELPGLKLAQWGPRFALLFQQMFCQALSKEAALLDRFPAVNGFGSGDFFVSSCR